MCVCIYIYNLKRNHKIILFIRIKKAKSLNYRNTFFNSELTPLFSCSTLLMFVPKFSLVMDQVLLLACSSFLLVYGGINCFGELRMQSTEILSNHLMGNCMGVMTS